MQMLSNWLWLFRKKNKTDFLFLQFCCHNVKMNAAAFRLPLELNRRDTRVALVSTCCHYTNNNCKEEKDIKMKT